MRSRLLLNLALLLILLILLLLVFYIPMEPDQPTASRLTELAPQNVTRIELQRQTGESLAFYKEQDIWYMQAPYTLAANDYRIQALLRLLQAEYASAHKLDKQDRTRYGLDPPRASLIYNDSLTIDFGDTEPLSQQRYVRIEDRLYLLPDTHYYHTASPATGYLSHALLPHGKITALQLPDQQLNLQDGQWQLNPAREDISADALTELIANWRAAQALRLEAYTEETLPEANLHVHLENQEQAVRFTIEQTGDQLSLVRHDVKMRYVINHEIRDQLLQLPEAIPEPELESSPRSHEAVKKN